MKFHALASVLIFWLACTNGYAKSTEITKAYLDKKKNVHMVMQSGEEIQITRHGKCQEPEVSEDRKTVAAQCADIKDGSSVWFFRNGRVRRIRGDPFTRGFWFVDGGEKIAVDKGGLHFAGREYLYDASTLKILDQFSQATMPPDKRPVWGANN